MCGILGVYSPSFSNPEFDIFEKLLFLNVFRGQDSTGVVRIERNKSTKTRKSLLPSPQFLASEASDIIRDKGTAAERPIGILGHTRAATKGAITLKNAHPFAFPHVVGVHNGTIHTSFKHRNEYETDSEALYYNINQYGIEEALNNANAYDSAWALAYVNKEDRTMNFVRNSKRPLWFTYIFGQSTLLWSSEKIALEYVMKHKGMTTNKGWRGSDKDQYFTLNPNEIMTFKIGDSPGDAKITKLDVEEKKTTGTTTGTHTAMLTGSASQQYQHGEWRKIGSGYEWVPKSKPALTLIQDSKKVTSTSTEITSVTPPATVTSIREIIEARERKKKMEATATSVSRPDDIEFQNHHDTLGMDGLKKLSWLKPPVDDELPQNVLDDMKVGLPELDWQEPGNQEPGESDVPFEGPYTNGDGDRTFRGYQGVRLRQTEFQQRLKEGCFACSESLSLDDPHDFDKINNMHWWTREYWACDYCFKNSDGDWVRCTIEDDWSQPGESAKK